MQNAKCKMQNYGCALSLRAGFARLKARSKTLHFVFSVLHQTTQAGMPVLLSARNESAQPQLCIVHCALRIVFGGGL